MLRESKDLFSAVVDGPARNFPERTVQNKFRQKAGPSTALTMIGLGRNQLNITGRKGRNSPARSQDASTLAADMHHGPRRGHKIRLADVVALFFLLDHAANKFA